MPDSQTIKTKIMKKKILIALALVISVITHSQITIQPADLKDAEKSVTITFTVKGNVIQTTYQVGGNPENRPMEQMSLNFLGNTRSQIILEDAWICSIVSKATAMSTTLQSAGKDKFAIPNNLPPGTYNFLLNDKLIATNYKVQ